MSSSIHFNSYSQWVAKNLRIFSLLPARHNGVLAELAAGTRDSLRPGVSILRRIEKSGRLQRNQGRSWNEAYQSSHNAYLFPSLLSPACRIDNLHFPFIWEIREGGLFELLRIFGLRMVTHSTSEALQNGHSTTNSGRWPDSNQRGFKRFVPTYAFERNFGGWAGQFAVGTGWNALSLVAGVG